MTINPVRYALHTTACLALLTVVSVALPNANVAFGQAGSKDTQKFQSLVDSTRGSLEKARAQFDTAMGAYNVIANSETDDPEKAYKNLTKQVSTSEKDWKSASKNFNNMQKAGQKLFASWQKEVDGFTNEQMKQISMDRLEEADGNYQRMTEQVAAAQAAYEPFMTSLQDQTLFMGRDMSPAAMEALQPMALELNDLAATLLSSIDAVLNQDAAIDPNTDPAAIDAPADDMAGDETSF